MTDAQRIAHYHDNDARPIVGGWACYCDHPESPDRPGNWLDIRAAATRFQLSSRSK